jgi:hypothetical protein
MKSFSGSAKKEQDINNINRKAKLIRIFKWSLLVAIGAD